MRTWIYAAIAVVIFAIAGLFIAQTVGTQSVRAQPPTGNATPGAADKHSGEVRKNAPRGERKILFYRNSMNSADTSPVPKKDGMGMDYVPVYAEQMSEAGGTIRISPEKIQRAGVRTDVVKRMMLTRTVRAAGTVTPDETKLAVITMKFSGFVEALFVSTTGAEVRAGQPLMKVWIESQEVLAKEVDYVVALRGLAGSVAQAANNLRLYGIPDSAIADMKRTRQATRSIVIDAPIDGTVLEKPAVVGMHFAAGDTLFKSADLSTVWVLAQVSERDLPIVQQGQMTRVVFTDNPEMTFQGQVTFVYPELDPATRTAQVRIVVANPDGRIRAGQYADVNIGARVTDVATLAVPDSAVLDSGARQIAFVAKGNGVFEPRALVLGRRGGGYVEVRQGLREGERIVVSGNFLIDAESNLQTALGTFSAETSQ